MKKYVVYDTASELTSELFDTREEAEKELEENHLSYGMDSTIILEVEA